MSDEPDIPFWQLPVPDETQDWRKRAAQIKDRLEVINAAEAKADAEDTGSNIVAATSTDTRRPAREPTRAEIIRLERAARDRARTEAKSSANDVSPVKVHTAVRHSPVKISPFAERAEANSINSIANAAATAPTKVEIRGADIYDNEPSPIEKQNQSLNIAVPPNMRPNPPRKSQFAATSPPSAVETHTSRQQSSSYTTETRRAEIAELMATLQATREQANGAACELVAQRQRAASRAQEADAARASFVSAQERSDSAALEKQNIALAQASPRLPTLPDDKEYDDGSEHIRSGDGDDGRNMEDGNDVCEVSNGGGSNQLHQGMVVVQGRRDLISQLRVGGSHQSTTNPKNCRKGMNDDDRDGTFQLEEVRRMETARAAAALAAEEDGPNYDLLDSLLREQKFKARTSSQSSSGGRDEKEQQEQPGIAESRRQQSMKALVQLADFSEPEEDVTTSQPFQGRSAEGDEQSEAAVPPDLRSAFARTELLDARAEAKESGDSGYRQSSVRSSNSNSGDKADAKSGNISAAASNQSSKLFECPVCKRTFKAGQHLKLHSNVHKREASDAAAAVALRLPQAAEAKDQAKEEEQDGNHVGRSAARSYRRNHSQPAFQATPLSPVPERSVQGSIDTREKDGAVRLSHAYGDDDKAAQSESKEYLVGSKTDVDESPEALAKRLQAGSGQGPNMEAMHRLWGILQSDAPNVNGNDGGRNASGGGGVGSAVEAGILQEVLGGKHPLMGQQPALPANAPSGPTPAFAMGIHAPVGAPALSAEEEANMTPEQRQKRHEYLDALTAREAAEHAEANAAAAAAQQRQQRIEVYEDYSVQLVVSLELAVYSKITG